MSNRELFQSACRSINDAHQTCIDIHVKGEVKPGNIREMLRHLRAATASAQTLERAMVSAITPAPVQEVPA